MKKNLALVAGGYSGEYAISVSSALTIEQNIDSSVYNIYKIIITKDNWLYTTPEGNSIAINKDNFTLPLQHETISFDVVFIGIHGTPGEDGKLQGYFDMLHIPYTGCKSIVSALTFNKIFCNRVVESYNVAGVAKSLHLFKDRPLTPNQILNQLKLPLFVKPCEGGSSLGTSKVKEPNELQAALDLAFAESNQIMAEEFVGGREATIGVYKVNGQVHTLPITEITTENEFFDYEAKYQGKSKEITPAILPDGVEYAIKDTASRIYNILNCDGVVRVDFIIENNTNRLFFLEVNTMPGQSAESIIPQQVREAGMQLQDFYGQLIEEALR